MAGFAEIIGHEQIIEHLQNAILSQKVSHAYILNGPDDSGKKMIAEAFAMALQCEKHGTEGCMEGRRTLSGMSFLQTGDQQKPAGYYLCDT